MTTSTNEPENMPGEQEPAEGSRQTVDAALAADSDDGAEAGGNDLSPDDVPGPDPAAETDGVSDYVPDA